MEKMILRDDRGRMIGLVEIDPNGNKRLRNAKGVYQGRYDKASNITRDLKGAMVARGDVLTTLLKN